jgi:hypothetical protein
VITNLFNLSNCAELARFKVSSVKYELNQLKEAIADKSTDKTETAFLELGELCSEYTATLALYEHLFTMAATAKQTETKQTLQVTA